MKHGAHCHRVEDLEQKIKQNPICEEMVRAMCFVLQHLIESQNLYKKNCRLCDETHFHLKYAWEA